MHVQRANVSAEIAEVARVERAEIVQRNARAQRPARGASLVVVVPRLDHLARRAHPPRVEHGHEPRLHLRGIDAQHARLGVHRRSVRTPLRGAQLHEHAIRAACGIVAVHAAPDRVDGEKEPVPLLAIVHLREHPECGEAIERLPLEVHVLHGARVARVHALLEMVVRRVAVRELRGIVVAVGRGGIRDLTGFRVVRIRREAALERGAHRRERAPVLRRECPRIDSRERRRERLTNRRVPAPQLGERGAIRIRVRSARARNAHAILHRMERLEHRLRGRERRGRARCAGSATRGRMTRGEQAETREKIPKRSASHCLPSREFCAKRAVTCPRAARAATAQRSCRARFPGMMRS